MAALFDFIVALWTPGAVPAEGCPQQGQGVTTAHLYRESRHVHTEFLHQSIPSQISLESARCPPLAELLEAVSVGVCSGHMRCVMQMGHSFSMDTCLKRRCCLYTAQMSCSLNGSLWFQRLERGCPVLAVQHSSKGQQNSTFIVYKVQIGQWNVGNLTLLLPRGAPGLEPQIQTRVEMVYSFLLNTTFPPRAEPRCFWLTSIKGQNWLPCTSKLSSCLQCWVLFSISLQIKGKRKTPAELLIGWEIAVYLFLYFNM